MASACSLAGKVASSAVISQQCAGKTRFLRCLLGRRHNRSDVTVTPQASALGPHEKRLRERAGAVAHST